MKIKEPLKNALTMSAKLSLIMLLFSISGYAQKVPSKKSVRTAMETANAYFMNKWQDPGASITTNTTRPSNIWTRAVYYEGLMSFYQTDPKKEYEQYAIDWGEKHNWGLRGGVNTRNADNQACGQTYIDLYQLDQQPKRISEIKASIDSMMKSGKTNYWTWIDAVQMGMPVFAKLGVLYHDPAYFELMYQLYMHTKTVEGGGLYNAKDALWWRDKSFVPPYKEPNGKDCYWARGNGWIVAASIQVQ